MIGADPRSERLEVDRLGAERDPEPMTAALAVAQEEILGVDATQLGGNQLRGLETGEDGGMVLPSVLDPVRLEKGVDGFWID